MSTELLDLPDLPAGMIADARTVVAVPGPNAGPATPYKAPVGSTAVLGVSNLVRGVAPASTLSAWRRARSRVLAGLGNASVLCVGDSLTAGAGSTGGNSSMSSNARSKAWPAQLAQQLAARGLTASWQSWVGGGGNTPGLGANTWTDYDARIAMGTATNSGIGTIGSNVLQLPGSGGYATFTPLSPVDRVVLLALQTGTTLSVSVDGGSSVGSWTVPSGGGHLVRKSPAINLGALAQHAIRVSTPGNGAFLVGMIATNSAVAEVSVLGAGWFGSTTTDWSPTMGTSWSPLDGIAEIAPDLTIVALTFNDIEATPLATFKTQLQSIITTAKASGDVILTVEQVGQATDLTHLAPFRAAVLAAAVSNNCPAIDITAIWGTSYASFGAAYGSGDGVHCSAAGYADVASIYRDVLLAA